MKKNDKSFFIETELGTVTQKGDWFRINKEQLEEFAPGLMKHITFSTLIKEAQAWVESVSSLSLILLYILFFFFNPWIAAAITLVFHFFWHHNKSAFVVNKVAKIFVVINSTAFLFIIALICLSYLAMHQQFAAFGIGLVFFILMKPGLLRKLWDRFELGQSKSSLTLNDRVLKMIIVKHALYQSDSSPEELADMEERFAAFVSKMKKGKK